MDVTRQDPLVGRTVDGRYQVESRIADGGMATVYRATDRRLDRDVALKVMHQHLVADSNFAARFVREARAAARLSHSNVVQVFDQGADGAVLYLAMEYLPGRTLRDVLSQRGALTPRESVSVLEPVLGALAAAHRAGIVHGDVKPENVILTDDGRIKVADFGLARAVTTSMGSTGSGEQLLGTVAYLAPELVSQGTVDARADVYAAGIMLFELLTGKQPFPDANPLVVAQRHVHDRVPAPTLVAPNLPAPFDEVVLRATEHDPDQRPADAGALLAELHAAAARVSDQQLDTRAINSPTLRMDVTRTEAFGAVPPGSASPLEAPTVVAEPAAASGPQPTRVLGVSRREIRSAGPGSLVPRLKVNEEELDGSRPPRSRLRRSIAPLSVLLVVLLLALTGAWWFTSGPGAYLSTPSLVGEQQGDAQRALSDLGLANQVALVFSTKVAAGQVISTVPAGGARVKKNGTVILSVSKGPQLIAVPDVTGMDARDATAALQDAHLKVGTTSKQASPTVALGRVISTTPTIGTKVSPGRAVDLVVSSGGGSIIKGAESGKCVAVPGASQNSGTQVVLWDCSGGPEQAWTATPSQQLTVYGGTKCLDVVGGSTDDGAIVQIYDCNGGTNQQWTLNPDGTIVGVGSGKCLDATNHGTADSTPIQIWSCGGSPNQKWARS